MSFDAHAYHIEKSHLKNYLASPNILNSTIWQHTSTGLEVVNEEDLSPFTGIIVGRVSAFRLKCGPEGNHINGGVSPLEKSKFQFHITRPANRELAADYQSAIGTLEALQNQVGRTVQHKNMVIDDVTGKMVRCVKNVFLMRDDAVPDSPHAESAKNAPQMDDETRNWPIADEFVAEFDSIKYNYQADPLPLYHDGHLVEPSHANAVMNGAIVEVELAIHHWRIQDFDSFQAYVQKIVILHPGTIHHTSTHKRQHPNSSAEPQEKKLRSEKA